MNNRQLTIHNYDLSFSLEQKFIQYHHYTGHILFAFDLGIDNT